MAVQSNIKTMVLCLTLTCIVCSAILGGVYAMTYSPIAKTQEKILKESIGRVLPNGGQISDSKPIKVAGMDSEYYESVKDGKIIGYAVKSQSIGFGGPLVLMVGIMPDGKIYNTSVLSQNETPGLGAKCSSDEKFMAQWRGIDPKNKKLEVKKDGGDIDAITASTITSRAYTLAVKNALDAIMNLENNNTK